MSDAHRKVERLNKFFAVANPEVRSYCDVGVGPLGRWIAVFAGIQGDISIDVTRMPSLRSRQATGAQLLPASDVSFLRRISEDPNRFCLTA